METFKSIWQTVSPFLYAWLGLYAIAVVIALIVFIFIFVVALRQLIKFDKEFNRMKTDRLTKQKG